MKARVRKLAEGEIIPLSYDFMFTSIFNKAENISILEEFVSFYLDIDIEEIKGNLKLLSRELELENRRQARRTIDLLLAYKGKKINIELSNYMSRAVIERNIVYACSVHARQLKYGDIHYKGIEQTIQINLLGYRRNKDKVRERYTISNENGEMLSDRLIIDIIDMVKGNELWYTEPANKLYSWCKLFLSNNEQELEESREYIMEKEAGERLDKEVRKLSQDDEMVYLYTKLSREELERNTYIEEAKEFGMEEGMKEGLKTGIEKGKIEKQKEIAKELLKINMPIEQINKVTKLSIAEIENL